MTFLKIEVGGGGGPLSGTQSEGAESTVGSGLVPVVALLAEGVGRVVDLTGRQELLQLRQRRLGVLHTLVYEKQQVSNTKIKKQLESHLLTTVLSLLKILKITMFLYRLNVVTEIYGLKLKSVKR